MPVKKPPPPPDREQRRHPRYELFVSVEFRQAGETLVLAARNLSIGGVLLNAGGHDLSRFPVGSTHHIMLFDAANESTPPVRTSASVVRHDNDGMALMWNGNDPRIAADIATLIGRLHPR